jgi:hypothetical protein
MIKRYTFLTSPYYYVLENASEMVAGLEKCIAVFYNKSTKNIEVLSFDKELLHINIENISFIESLRKSKKRTNWIQANQVPFELSNHEIGQLSFSDEEKSSVLEMRFLNSIDGNYDVIYFYFKNNIANFKLSNTNEVMAVTVKEVIQNLLYNQIQLILQSNNSDGAIHQKIASTYSDSHLQGKINQLEKELFEQAKSNYTYLLNKLTEKETVEFVLSDAAVVKLSQTVMSLESAAGVLENSLEIVLNKYNPSGFYELSVNDLILNNISNQPSITVKQENLNKTQLFLDRYEAAAKILISKQERVTGLNIGNNCYPKVSPAAISDVLKKHHKKINILFQQHPDKWPIIRAKFKPMVNVYERYLSEHQIKRGA